MKTFPEIAVVIPVHNETSNISALIDEIEKSLGNEISFELVIVDDFSTDDTAEVVRQLFAGRAWLILARHASNAGQSAAVLTGIKSAKAAWIVTLDGDGQNDPADIMVLWKKHLNRPDTDLVCGHRQKRKDTFRKRIASRIANGIRRRLLSDDTPDSGCGLKLFRREVFLALPHFNHFHRFLPALFKRQGSTICSVPVNHRARGGGQPHYGISDRLWVGIVDILGVLWLGRRPVHVPVLKSENGSDEKS